MYLLEGLDWVAVMNFGRKVKGCGEWITVSWTIDIFAS